MPNDYGRYRIDMRIGKTWATIWDACAVNPADAIRQYKALPLCRLHERMNKVVAPRYRAEREDGRYFAT